jgi:CheY-like chemotaxis protein
MYFNTQFNILVVDDDPDVLALTKGLLQDMEVFGLPLHVETARSKAEALEVFERSNQPNNVQPMIAVALIDVVMETDHAGLELCDTIRNQMGNYTTQLFVRTGQPGTVPERAVIDQYDINGYYTEADLDETKLYSLVKSGIRQADTVALAIGMHMVAEMVVVQGQTRESLDRMMFALVDAMRAAGGIAEDGQPLIRMDTAHVLDGNVKSTMDPEETERLRAELEGLERRPLNDAGDYYTSRGTCYLVYVAPSPVTVESYGFARGQMEAKRYFIELKHKYYRIASAVWKRAGERQRGANGQRTGLGLEQAVQD